MGAAGYQGDLELSIWPDMEELGSQATFLLQRKLGHNWAVGAVGGYARQESEDDYLQRGFTFQTDLYHFQLRATWEPTGHCRYPGTYLFEKRFTPYAFVQVGGAWINSQTDFSRNQLDYLQESIEQDQREPSAFVIPMVGTGAGIKRDLSKRWAIMVELGTQTAFSDYLDGVSQAGNADARDWLPFGQAGLLMRFLPKDTDKDGIADENDACPRVAGVLAAQGCPDTDLDGVEDLEDLCPNEAGVARLNGCPDDDGDGIANHNDQCPKQAGSVSTAGCPDTDQDGLADRADQCPYLPGKPFLAGCPALDVDADGNPDSEEPLCHISTYGCVLDDICEEIRPYSILLEATATPIWLVKSPVSSTLSSSFIVSNTGQRTHNICPTPPKD